MRRRGDADRALAGPTLSSSKLELAEMCASGMRPLSMPSATSHPSEIGGVRWCRFDGVVLGDEKLAV